MSVLRTDRLELRRLRMDDDQFIVKLLNEPEFVRHIGDKGVRTVSDARAYLAGGPIESYERRGFGLYLVSLAEGGDPIGICGLLKRDALPDVNVGFAFLSRHCSKGYATEAAAAMLDYGRRALGLPRIVAITSPDNHGSIAVLKKIGLAFERMVRIGAEGGGLQLYGPGGGADPAGASPRRSAGDP